MKKGFSLKTKISLLVLTIVLCSTTIVGIISYGFYRRDSLAVNADKVRAIAESVAAAVDGGHYAALLASREKDAYWYEIKRYVDEVMARTGVQYLYLLDKNYGAVVRYFTEAGAPGATDVFSLGEEEEISVHADELFETLRTGVSTITGIYDSGDYGMMVSGFAPIRDAHGAVAGVVGVDLRMENVLTSSYFFGLVILLCAILFSGLFWFLSRVYIQRGIGNPVAALARASDRIADGDLEVELAVHSGDEIGYLTASFMEMVNSTKTQCEVLDRIAEGDLTVEVSARSEYDSMSLTLKKTIDNLRNMFTEIQSATNQVSSGSKHVADGAQLLAQGAVEQAASIEELSGSIAEIAERTRINAATAGQTAKLSETIKENAEKGSRQMSNMITAVKEIDDASHSISKIIKTIDDIAFQTNILALNAAVEAARAGQQGKGFAVVAEEVRNLASKSAEAARDTNDMIQNSINKAALGSRIAGETAASLGEIMAGINESSHLIAEIAKLSEEQSRGITLINTGIDQVALVVQHNSATAEESAAVSEEMSSQSEILRRLIAQFKLHDTGTIHRRDPARLPMPT